MNEEHYHWTEDGRIVDDNPAVEAYKADIDITLIRENLKLTAEQRLIKLQRMAEFVDELRRAGREARGEK
jgi:hypothetical protein